MGKMKELNQILDDMVEAGNGMIEAANALREYFTSEEIPAREPTNEQPMDPVQKKSLTKEEVRKLLVEKSNLDGGEYKPMVKALVRKYSESGNLGSVNPEDYDALVAELEVIGNA